MNEHQFKKLLIDLINMDSYPDKEALVALIKISTIDFVKTSEFARRGVWDQRQEYIYFSIIPDKLMELKKHEKYIEKKCEELYPISKDYALFGIIFKPGAMTQEEDISQEIVFENIRNQIVEELQNAKYVIFVAMAWFTDPILYKELLKKKKQGVIVEIVLDDNETNRSTEFDIENDFSTYWVNIQSRYKNIMHEKFCVIDLQTVIVIFGTLSLKPTTITRFNFLSICMPEKWIVSTSIRLTIRVREIGNTTTITLMVQIHTVIVNGCRLCRSV